MWSGIHANEVVWSGGMGKKEILEVVWTCWEDRVRSLWSVL